MFSHLQLIIVLVVSITSSPQHFFPGCYLELFSCSLITTAAIAAVTAEVVATAIFAVAATFITVIVLLPLLPCSLHVTSSAHSINDKNQNYAKETTQEKLFIGPYVATSGRQNRKVSSSWLTK
jgi:hypothetical protein